MARLDLFDRLSGFEIDDGNILAQLVRHEGKAAIGTQLDVHRVVAPVLDEADDLPGRHVENRHVVRIGVHEIGARAVWGERQVVGVASCAHAADEFERMRVENAHEGAAVVDDVGVASVGREREAVRLLPCGNRLDDLVGIARDDAQGAVARVRDENPLSRRERGRRH